VAIAQGCSPTADPPPDLSTSGPGVGGSGGAGGAPTTTATGTGGDFTPVTSASGSGGGTGCQGGTPDDDFDKDGFTEAQNDCNDCDPGVNPDAVDVVAKGENGQPDPPPVDEDCDGFEDNQLPSCDDGLALDSADPMDAAKAIGICKYATSAKWVLADGSPPPVEVAQLAAFHLGHGILDNLGPKNMPQEGKQLLMLSSGTARKEGDPQYVHRNYDKKYTSNQPFGFPKESPSCPGIKTKTPHDATGLEVELKAPPNAQGISFDFNFFTFEWPQYICKEFNDFFVAIMTPFPPMQTDGNISFDPNGNAISVNNAFLGACACPSGPPCFVPPPNGVIKYDCPLGLDVLVGTDFDDDDGTPVGWTNGSTSWLRTQAPVEPGKTFTIRFVTYDSSDGMVDSAALIDNWKWSAKPGTVNTDVVPK
jgi:hypothetical protein